MKKALFGVLGLLLLALPLAAHWIVAGEEAQPVALEAAPAALTPSAIALEASLGYSTGQCRFRCFGGPGSGSISPIYTIFTTNQECCVERNFCDPENMIGVSYNGRRC